MINNLSTSASGTRMLSLSDLEEAQGGFIPFIAVVIAATALGATIGENCGERANRADDKK